MIAPQTIEEIRKKADLVAIVSEYVKLRKTGKNYVGLCPFHSEKTPSFTVSPDKQLFHCFGCGEGGNVFSFIMKMENIGFAEAVKELGARVGIKIEETGSSSFGIPKTEKEKLYEAMLLAARFFRKCLEEEGGKAAQEYLKKRGISEETAKTFSLGFAPEGWDNLFKHLLSRGVAPELIERCGLTLPREGKDGYYDRFRNRLIFPVIDVRGRVVAFSGRSLKEEEPKYLNSPDTVIYQKGNNIFGLNFAKESIKEQKKAVLVEGNFDLLTAFQAGFTNVVASLGTALTVAQCKLLARFSDIIILAFDSDAAGGAAAERSVELLREQELKVRVAELQGAKDPDELIRNFGAEAFKKAVDSALPFVEFKLKRILLQHDLSKVEDRSRALREAAAVLSREQDNFVQKEYAKMISGQLKADPESILAEIKRQNFYKRETEKDLRRVIEKPASKITEAEKHLLVLSLQNANFLNLLKKEMQVEQFKSAETRSIAEFLFETDTAGVEKLDHFVLENLPNESARKFLAKALLEDTPANPEKVFQDCLQVIKSEGAKSRINYLKAELQKAEKEGEFGKVTELLAALKNETMNLSLQ